MTTHSTLTPTRQVFHGVANFCMLVFDATSVGSFEVSKREASAWRVVPSPPLTQLRRGALSYLLTPFLPLPPRPSRRCGSNSSRPTRSTTRAGCSSSPTRRARSIDRNPSPDPAPAPSDNPSHIYQARMGIKRDISSGFARDWCESRGSVAYFEVDEEASQGLLGPMQHVAQEYLSVSHSGQQ